MIKSGPDVGIWLEACTENGQRSTHVRIQSGYFMDWRSIFSECLSNFWSILCCLLIEFEPTVTQQPFPMNNISVSRVLSGESRETLLKPAMRPSKYAKNSAIIQHRERCCKNEFCIWASTSDFSFHDTEKYRYLELETDRGRRGRTLDFTVVFDSFGGRTLVSTPQKILTACQKMACSRCSSRLLS